MWEVHPEVLPDHSDNLSPKEMHDGIHDPAYQNRIAVLRNLLIWELDGREEGYTDLKL